MPILERSRGWSESSEEAGERRSASGGGTLLLGEGVMVDHSGLLRVAVDGKAVYRVRRTPLVSSTIR